MGHFYPFQSKSMVWCVVATILLVGGCQAYPGGSPSCTSSPGHGAYRGNTQARVTNIGGNNWQVTVPQNHKLPDGRTQHVSYTANDIEGYVATVTYDGQAVYPEAVAVAHPVAHAVRPVVAHLG